MTTKDDFFESFSKLGSKAADSLSGFKEDANNFIKARIEHKLNDLELVQKEEFEALKLMVIHQAQEIKELKEKLGVPADEPSE